MDCKRNPTLEEIDQYAEKELELKRAQQQQQEKWMEEMMQEEIQAFNAAFQKLVDEGIFEKLIIFDLKSPKNSFWKLIGSIPPIADDFEPVDISDEEFMELIELDIKTRQQAFEELNQMAFQDPFSTPKSEPETQVSTEDPAM